MAYGYLVTNPGWSVNDYTGHWLKSAEMAANLAAKKRQLDEDQEENKRQDRDRDKAMALQERRLQIEEQREGREAQEWERKQQSRKNVMGQLDTLMAAPEDTGGLPGMGTTVYNDTEAGGPQGVVPGKSELELPSFKSYLKGIPPDILADNPSIISEAIRNNRMERQQMLKDREAQEEKMYDRRRQAELDRERREYQSKMLDLRERTEKRLGGPDDDEEGVETSVYEYPGTGLKSTFKGTQEQAEKWRERMLKKGAPVEDTPENRELKALSTLQGLIDMGEDDQFNVSFDKSGNVGVTYDTMWGWGISAEAARKKIQKFFENQKKTAKPPTGPTSGSKTNKPTINID